MDTVAIVGIVGLIILGIVAIVHRGISQGKLKVDRKGVTFEVEIGQGPPGDRSPGNSS
jgi:hypothetical protein